LLTRARRGMAHLCTAMDEDLRQETKLALGTKRHLKTDTLGTVPFPALKTDTLGTVPFPAEEPVMLDLQM